MASGAYLSFEILNMILLLLPPQALIRFTSVCKAWRDLIRTPRFGSEYMNTGASKDAGYFLYLSVNPNRPNEEKITFNLLDDKSLREESMVRFPSDFRWYPNVHLVGSFNGVLCLTEMTFFGTTIYLVNPSIWKYRMIRSSSIDIWLITDIVLGFAYHPQVDDFKIVRIGYGSFGPPFTAENKDDFDVGIELYSMSTNSWKEIKAASFPWYIYESFSEVVIHETLHWMSKDGGVEDGELVILSFDLNSEEFKEVYLPENREMVGQDSNNVGFMQFLGVFKEKLCVFAYCPPKLGHGRETCELWVMMEYGNEKSWNKMYSIKVDGGIQKPLKFGRNGEIIMVDEDLRVIVYDFGTKVLTYLGNVPSDSSFVNFTESLALMDEINQPIIKGVKAFPLPPPGNIKCDV